MKKKNVSVIMATYNGELFLDMQMKSIFDQTYPISEVIVCDDLSSDGTTNLLRNYLKNPLFTFVINESRLGVAENFKKAASLTISDSYIVFSDQDDVWLPNKIEKLVAKLSEIDDGNRPAMVYSDLTVIDNKGKTLNPSFWNELDQDVYKHTLETLLFGNFVTGCTMLINQKMKELLLNMPPTALMHDYWTALIAYSIGNVARVDQPLVLYRKHGNNTVFSANYKKPNKVIHWLKTFFTLFVGDKSYLNKELIIVELFYKSYTEILADKEKMKFLRFISLKGKTFLQKKILFHQIFYKNRI